MAGMFDFIPKMEGTNSASSIVDFAEIQCLMHDDLSVSVNDVSFAINAESHDDDKPEDQVDDSEVEDAPEVWKAFDDVDARRKHCGNDAFYPFRRIGEDAGQVKVCPVERGQQWHALLYLFLLWLTRTSEPNAGDARMFFERLCCQVARNYWGGGVENSKVRAIHFGEPGGFGAKVEKLAQQLSERGGFREEALSSGAKPQDDGVDLVVFRPFADGRVGQAIGFGQCKSGHGYDRKELTECNPDSFIGNWFRQGTTVGGTFVKMFFLSDRIANNELMFQHGNRAGVLFDRCRIMEHAANVDQDLKGEIAGWILDRLDKVGALARLEAAGINPRFKAE